MMIAAKLATRVQRGFPQGFCAWEQPDRLPANGCPRPPQQHGFTYRFFARCFSCPSLSLSPPHSTLLLYEVLFQAMLFLTTLFHTTLFHTTLRRSFQ